MLVIGSKGHAIEILQIFEQKNKTEKLRFFDNVSSDIPEKLFNKFSILKNFEEAQTIFNSDNKFVLGWVYRIIEDKWQKYSKKWAVNYAQLFHHLLKLEIITSI